jgi:hypothetical protein
MCPRRLENKSTFRRFGLALSPLKRSSERNEEIARRDARGDSASPILLVTAHEEAPEMVPCFASLERGF